jgi:hypothetical protein
MGGDVSIRFVASGLPPRCDHTRRRSDNQHNRENPMSPGSACDRTFTDITLPSAGPGEAPMAWGFLETLHFPSKTSYGGQRGKRGRKGANRRRNTWCVKARRAAGRELLTLSFFPTPQCIWEADREPIVDPTSHQNRLRGISIGEPSHVLANPLCTPLTTRPFLSRSQPHPLRPRPQGVGWRRGAGRHMNHMIWCEHTAGSPRSSWVARSVAQLPLHERSCLSVQACPYESPARPMSLRLERPV